MTTPKGRSHDPRKTRGHRSPDRGPEHELESSGRTEGPRPIEDDYQRHLEDKEADWKEDQKALAKEVGQWGKEDLAQHEITQFLRYLQACGNHDAPFDLKAHLPRIQSLLDAHDKPGPT